MNTARYFLILFAALGSLAAGNAFFAYSQFGRSTPNGYANCAYIEKKRALASDVASPKLLIVGGSNAAAGIDASALQTALGVPVFNFSLFATFSPVFDFFEARKALRSGDAVLLAFEYLAYEYEMPTNALVDTIYSCGMDYWQTLDWTHRLLYVFAVRPQRYFSTLAFSPSVAERATRMAEDTIAPDGDLASPFPVPAPASNTHTPLVIRFHADSEGARQIEAFADWAKANGIRVFATWPNTLYFKEYERIREFGMISDFYGALDVPVIGTPIDAMVPPEQLAETIYHLTESGIAQRTERLAKALGNDPDFSAWRSCHDYERLKTEKISTCGDHKN
jgi:hypothetical protein